jgi:hypothetical protein
LPVSLPTWQRPCPGFKTIGARRDGGLGWMSVLAVTLTTRDSRDAMPVNA